MGWMSFSMHKPVKEWFKEIMNDNVEVLDIAIVKRNTLYAALKVKATNEVFCVVYLLRWSKGMYNFSYKDMSEFCGPCETECPLRIMRLLTPLNDTNDVNGWARNWRDKVYKYWDAKEKINSGKFIVKTETPVKFTNGLSFSYFKKIGKKLFAGALQANGIFASYCSVRFNLKYWNYELIECQV